MVCMACVVCVSVVLVCVVCLSSMCGIRGVFEWFVGMRGEGGIGMRVCVWVGVCGVCVWGSE